MNQIKSFVLRSGRISNAQKRSYTDGQQFLIPFSDIQCDLSLFFGNDNPITVEIGFGMGKATAEIAASNPAKNYLGIEVFRAGIGKLLWEINQRHLSNIRIIEYDAVQVIEKMIAPNSIAAFHLFFPDPWPKKRHHKRRLVQKPFAQLLASRLDKGGYVYFISDWEHYAEQALAVFSQIPEFFNPHGGTFAPANSWRPLTKFEEKGIEKDHTIMEIYLVKTAIGKSSK